MTSDRLPAFDRSRLRVLPLAELRHDLNLHVKALPMVRNVAAQEGRRIADFTTLVYDLVELPTNYRTEASREEALYYFRPWKTMLVRTVADGGESWYLRLPYHESVPQLWTALKATQVGPEEPAP